MSDVERVTVAEAAQRMHVSPQFIRMGLRAGILPFGWAVKTGEHRYTYFIVRTQFEKAVN